MTATPAASNLPPAHSRSWKADATPEEQAQLRGFLEQAFATPFVQQVGAHAVALLQPAPGQSILEVGCGSGVFLPLLARHVGPAGSVVGIDHSAAMVADAVLAVGSAGLSSQVTVLVGDACRLDFDDNSFDGAHCERVLMHLDDPTAALREMARVVRPGGLIVAAEPDWGGIRIDHPERADFDRVYHQSLAMRNPDMGLTLVRRMGEVGLTGMTARPVMAVFTDMEMVRGYGLNLLRGADALVQEGALSRERADQLLARLDELNAAGHYYAAGVFHVVAGRVPG